MVKWKNKRTRQGKTRREEEQRKSAQKECGEHQLCKAKSLRPQENDYMNKANENDANSKAAKLAGSSDIGRVDHKALCGESL